MNAICVGKYVTDEVLDHCIRHVEFILTASNPLYGGTSKLYCLATEITRRCVEAVHPDNDLRYTTSEYLEVVGLVTLSAMALVEHPTINDAGIVDWVLANLA